VLLVIEGLMEMAVVPLLMLFRALGTVVSHYIA
jgi:hypothetical protein